MSGQELMQMAGAVVSFVLILGLLVFFCLLLNLRDRRQTRVLNTMLDQLGSRDLRGRVAVQVHCGVLSRRSRVMVRVWARAAEEIWAVFTRLSRTLPPEVGVVMDGTVEGEFSVTLTSPTGRPFCPSRPSLVTG